MTNVCRDATPPVSSEADGSDIPKPLMSSVYETPTVIFAGGLSAAQVVRSTHRPRVRPLPRVTQTDAELGPAVAKTGLDDDDRGLNSEQALELPRRPCRAKPRVVHLLYCHARTQG